MSDYDDEENDNSVCLLTTLKSVFPSLKVFCLKIFPHVHKLQLFLEKELFSLADMSGNKTRSLAELDDVCCDEREQMCCLNACELYFQTTNCSLA